jgi:hypothetical protein
VLLPAGTFVVDTTLYLPTGVHLAGAGASATRLVAAPGGRFLNGIVFNRPGAQDVGVFLLAVDGDRGARSAPGTEGGVFFDGVARPVVQQVAVRRTFGECLRFNGGSTDGWADRNLLEDCGAEGSEAHGLMLASPTETMYWTNRTPATTVRHLVTRNTVRLARNTGIMLYNVRDVVVASNVVEDARLARGINSGPTTSNVAIIGNTVTRAHSTGIHFYASTDAWVIGNTVTNTVADGSGLGIEGQCIKAYVGGGRFRIWNNVVRGCATDGIALMAGVTDASIEGNTITDNGRDGVRLLAGGPGGLNPGDVTDVVVAGNAVHSNRGRGVWLAGQDDHVVKGWTVTGNRISGNRVWSVDAAAGACAGTVGEGQADDARAPRRGPLPARGCGP